MPQLGLSTYLVNLLHQLASSTCLGRSYSQVDAICGLSSTWFKFGSFKLDHLSFLLVKPRTKNINPATFLRLPSLTLVGRQRSVTTFFSMNEANSACFLCDDSTHLCPNVCGFGITENAAATHSFLYSGFVFFLYFFSEWESQCVTTERKYHRVIDRSRFVVRVNRNSPRRNDDKQAWHGEYLLAGDLAHRTYNITREAVVNFARIQNFHLRLSRHCARSIANLLLFLTTHVNLTHVVSATLGDSPSRNPRR